MDVVSFLQRSPMKKPTRITLIVLAVFLSVSSLAAAGYFMTQTSWYRSRVLFESFKKKSPEVLTSSQKVILLAGYCRSNDIRSASAVYAGLNDEIPALTKYERLSIANHYGRILRETGQGAEELSLYGDLFRNEYPAYFHLFLAQAYGKRGEYSKRRAELTLAYRDARRVDDEEALTLIESLFKEIL